jgi:predicted nicotinamide N-methyase
MLTSELTTKDAMISGMAGAAALTAVHQAARMITDTAPRMDVVGMRAIARGEDAATGTTAMADATRQNPALYNMALAGDLVFNSAYYSMATTWTRGAALGLLAGIGALVLPQKLGLGDPPKSELLSNQMMTVAWYLIGGLAAAWTAQCLAEKRADQAREFVGGY